MLLASQAAGGWVHNGRLNGVLAVSRAFGDIEHKLLKEKCWEKAFTSDPLIVEPVRAGLMGFAPAALVARVVKRFFATNALSPSLSQEVYSIARQAADEFIIIASDGLWSVLTSQQVSHALASSTPYQKMALPV